MPSIVNEIPVNNTARIDPRLNDIDDCLYRVAARVLIVHENRILLIKEVGDEWWALPGGGVDHGENIEATVLREVEEELGVSADSVQTDFGIVHYTIGSVVNGVPRMNLFFKVAVPDTALQKTDHVIEWRWFTKDDFMQADLHMSYDKTQLARVIFE